MKLIFTAVIFSVLGFFLACTAISMMFVEKTNYSVTDITRAADGCEKNGAECVMLWDFMPVESENE